MSSKVRVRNFGEKEAKELFSLAAEDQRAAAILEIALLQKDGEEFRVSTIAKEHFLDRATLYRAIKVFNSCGVIGLRRDGRPKKNWSFASHQNVTTYNQRHFDFSE